MLYRLIRPFATAALKINFRKIYFSNAQVVPKNKPVILAVNHPTAFLEPCLLACLLPQPLHFIVRGDVFKNRMVKKIFDWLHLIPIYRIQDAGYGGLKNNFQTFEKCFETLKRNKTILILAEGNTVQEKRLRPIQKGTARMALGALKRHPGLDLYIVPVGVNYTEADRFRSIVMFEFGRPIEVRPYLASFQNNPGKAINKLTGDLKTELEKHVTIIEKKADEALVEKLFSINRNDFPAPARPVVSLDNHLLKKEQAIAARVEKMTGSQKAGLDGMADEYLEHLSEHDLEDWSIAQKNVKKTTGWLVVAIGFLPFLLGYAGNFLPAFFADYIAVTRVKYLEFIASVRVAVAIGAFLLYYAILLAIALLMKNLFLALFVLLLPFLGYYSILYREYFKKWKWLKTFWNTDKTTRDALKKERQELLDRFFNKSLLLRRENE